MLSWSKHRAVHGENCFCTIAWLWHFHWKRTERRTFMACICWVLNKHLIDWLVGENFIRWLLLSSTLLYHWSGHFYGSDGISIYIRTWTTTYFLQHKVEVILFPQKLLYWQTMIFIFVVWCTLIWHHKKYILGNYRQ